jgi:hypothetical protein
VDRGAAAKLIGYSSLSGPANQALATLALYGLVERAGKGEMRVTARAQAILHPNSDEEKRRSLREAAFEPSLFRELRERWPNITPPEDGVMTYLNRQGFNQSAIKPAARAYLQTLSYLEETDASESHGAREGVGVVSSLPDDDAGAAATPVVYGGARVGDIIQWESQGALQFEKPMRVRLVSDDGQWAVVEGSDTGIPMSEVIVQERGVGAAPPRFALAPEKPQEAAPDVGELEWMRSRLGSSTKVRLIISGEMGPREINKLIKLLRAQRDVLKDDDDDDDTAEG